MPSGPKRLIIVRHAESLRNAIPHGRFFEREEDRDQCGGLANHHVPLTAVGEIQAAEMGRAFRERFGVPDALYHSGYLRTRQTADGLLAAYPDDESRGVEVREHMFIRERDSGYTYDMTTDEACGHFPFIQRHWDTTGGFYAVPVGGESIAKVAERVYHFLRELNEEQDGRTVVIVTHGGVIRALRYWLERLPHDEVMGAAMPGPRNCGVTVYDRGEDGRLHLTEYDTIMHVTPSTLSVDRS